MGKKDLKDKMVVIRCSGKKIAEVFAFLESPTEDQEFLSKITSQIDFRDDIGFAGYKYKKTLKAFLAWSIYGSKNVDTWNSVSINECKTEIEFVLKKCSRIIQNKIIKIFIFPTIDSFVIDKMNGVAGFTPWKNVILLNICRTKNWNKALKDTICHELAHALALNFNNRETIEDDLIFEGIAEHFRENFLDKDKAKWTESISEKKAKKILLEIKPELKKRNEKLYHDLFFGTGKYPPWSGYTIGYNLVQTYLKKVNKKDWTKLLKIKPSEIMKDNTFLIK